MNANAPPSPSLWTDLRQLPRCYWILFSGTLINRFGHFVMPFLALYLRRLGYDAWVAGASLAAYGAGALVANLAGGYFADRVGRKPTILVSCAGAAVAMIALSQARSPIAIVAVSGACGLASAMYFPAASALLADLVPANLRIRAFACQRLAVNLGFSLGMIAAGALAERSFLLLFVIDASTTVVLGLFVLLGLPGGTRRAAAHAGWGVAVEAMRANPAYLRAVFSSFCIAVVFWQVSSTWGLHVATVGGHGESAYGWLMALNGLMIATLELPLTSLTRRFPAPRVMACGYLLVGAGIGLSAFGSSLPLLVVVMIVFTLGEMIALPVSHSFIAGLSPDEMRGRFMGALGMAWSAATMLGPAAGLALFDRSPVLVWIGSFLVGVMAAISVLGIRASRTEAAEEKPANAALLNEAG